MYYDINDGLSAFNGNRWYRSSPRFVSRNIRYIMITVIHNIVSSYFVVVVAVLPIFTAATPCWMKWLHQLKISTKTTATATGFCSVAFTHIDKLIYKIFMLRRAENQLMWKQSNLEPIFDFAQFKFNRWPMRLPAAHIEDTALLCRAWPLCHDMNDPSNTHTYASKL